jgi:SNF2 family DNA or RNA helicase
MTETKVPYSHKPGDITLDEWQRKLRKQFAKEQKYKISNIGNHPFFSDFEVYNPESDKTYKVSIRDNVSSFNFCSCPDFRISVLGTCKHVEYLLYYFSKYKKYQKYFHRNFTPEYSSLSVYYGTERKIRLRKALNAPMFAGEDALFDADGFLLREKTALLGQFISDAINIDSDLKVYKDVNDYSENYRIESERSSKAEELFKEGINSEVLKDLINADLYSYQKEGVRKIIEAGRLLLADDMGLGKTIQSIAATEIFVKHFAVSKVLIICPTSLKYQWKKEIEKFSGRKAIIVEGSISTRKILYEEKALYKIISYGICLHDQELIDNMNSELVIIDEAQRIKNWKTKTAQAVKKIMSEYTIVLTGTPMENRIDELHSIIEYVDRYKLGPLFRFLDKHQVIDERGKLLGYKNLRVISQTLDDIMLRRTRKEIRDQLPGRVDKNFFIEMTGAQQRAHNGYYEIVKRLVNLWMIQGFLSDEDRERLLSGLNCMRMVCDSTYLVNQNEAHGNKIEELEVLLNGVLEEDDNKIVIFSQWKRMFELVIKLLNKLRIPYLYLNGDLPAKKREEILNEFQTGKRIKVFLSTDAGGIGVNLQSANVLINLDLPWNPAVLEQRIGRIYRLGQKMSVNIYNLITRNSIEHRIMHLLKFKRAVFEGVIEEEGKDEVMLEGFMASVKAMTDIDLEKDDVEESKISYTTAGDADSKDNISDNSTIRDSEISTKEERSEEVLKPTTPAKRIGFFKKLKSRFKKLLNLLLGDLRK